jgi:MYXO-CTERM domain-containing protein
MVPAFPRRVAALVAAALAAASLVSPRPARAEPAACLSPDPTAWPSPSRPYFMVVVDTSGSMGISVAGSTSCGYQSNRLGHARCAVKNTVLAYSGAVNFGLSSYTWKETACSNATCGTCASGTCFPQCTPTYAAGDNNFCGPLKLEPTLGANVHAGGLVVVPMLQDHFWAAPPDPTNAPSILNYVDNNCGNSELGANSNTPIGGSLFSMNQYFSGAYVDPFTNLPVASPLGTAAQGERGCRSLNIILITDGDETCDFYNSAAYPNDEGLGVYEANRLNNTGVTIGGQNFKVKVHVIGFVGATVSALDNIANAGGTGTAYSTANEQQLSQALSNIIAGAIKPETCDNTDNNCNGCTDEGYTHYCDNQPVPANCCAWTTPAQRTTCLTSYQSSISVALPKGNPALLPCTTPAQQANPAQWLCYDPGEKCDNTDNNCSGGTDEGITKCGSPLHCPQAETCNGQDDDCDGVVDNGGVCAGCVPSPEICDGCDNDCDGQIDEGIATIPCGQMSPANCSGTISCKTIAGSFPAGTCVAGGGFNACSNAPATETCDSTDNNCNGIVDDGIASAPCVPAGTPAGLDYGVNSQCKKGHSVCTGGATTCVGFVGPSAEVCDGIDNNCNGTVDDGATGAGQACGVNQPPCTPGTTACVAGVIVCQGAVGPQPEKCDGIDNNCNGVIDDGTLTDGPQPGQNGCWPNAGNCCSFPLVNPNLHWCPPSGATCNGNGVLTTPCNKGALVCTAGAWVCQNPKTPSAETCDGIDNNCNGVVDDGVPLVGTACGTNTGACNAGVYACAGGVLSCNGGTGPSVEICDGIDNDCDGQIDNNVPGTGGLCGNATPPCSPGVVTCAGGSLVCQGGVGPTQEICDGIDNNCNGQVDEGNLADAPQPGQNGCWSNAGNCCTFNNLHWCPPAGATCSTKGALTVPCGTGTIVCASGAWACTGPKGPAAESCDAVDNNCDGLVDNVPPVACVPAGTPGGLVYGGSSQCKQGTKTCGACVGFVGPSAELCDGLDNNCNGVVDDGIPGLGAVCGVNQPPCTPGTTACLAGAIVCAGAVGPQAEVCDGIDNDCDGTPDNGALADAPAQGMSGCWSAPGNCCTFKNLSWCPPTGGACNGPGTLSAPCSQGSLACAGGAGWVCQGGKVPAAEACDGVDNDCNGTVDDGSFPQVGTACGSTLGECKAGVIACAVGVLDCVGDVGPTQEICDGLDNDCDGVIDNGIGAGGPCTPPYDPVAYPGDRSALPCQPGQLQCNGMGGLACVGGVGPKPEVCDGVDNDCDGTVDEVGAAPDGIDGSANPLPPPAANIGDSCGLNVGACAPGKEACVNGSFACLGGQGPVEEACDCSDNDCDGKVDNQTPNGAPLCSPGKSCVSSAQGCLCASPCSTGEFPCPPGQKCEVVTDSSTGQSLGGFCTTDYAAVCGDCTTKTILDANAKVICAPAGTELANCVAPPQCVCKGPNGCNEPCLGVVCGAGQVCASSGPNVGKCAPDNCWNNPCQGCGKACNLGACVADPCTTSSCPPDQECKPNATFTGFDCVASCSGVMCAADQVCKDGKCTPTCSPACAAGQVCDTSASPPTCGADKCSPNPCTNGACCDPVTGACGNCPCAGVVCPAGQSCSDGQCGVAQMGTGSGGGSSASSGGGGDTTSTTTSGATGSTGAGGAGGTKGIWGLATGGGGCACKTSGTGLGSGSSSGEIALVVAAGLLGLGRRRRRESDARREEAGR